MTAFQFKRIKIVKLNSTNPDTGSKLQWRDLVKPRKSRKRQRLSRPWLILLGAEKSMERQISI